MLQRGDFRRGNDLVTQQPFGFFDASLKVADGVGSTREEAFRDAFRSAVRQAVGAVVEAETVVQDDRVVADRVLDYSGGVVRSYKELKAEKQALVAAKFAGKGGLILDEVSMVWPRDKEITRKKAD